MRISICSETYPKCFIKIITCKQNNNSIAHLAALSGNIEALEYIVKKNCSLNLKNNDVHTKIFLMFL